MPRSAARLLLALWTLVLVAGMLTPGERLPDADLFTYDKLIHLGAFALWAVLAVPAVPGWRRIVLLGGLLAVGTEVAQEAIETIHRTGEVADAVADGLGIALGIGLMRGAEAWRRRAEEGVIRATTGAGPRTRPS